MQPCFERLSVAAAPDTEVRDLQRDTGARQGHVTGGHAPDCEEPHADSADLRVQTARLHFSGRILAPPGLTLQTRLKPRTFILYGLVSPVYI